jgi:hypothetical protein
VTTLLASTANNSGEHAALPTQPFAEVPSIANVHLGKQMPCPDVAGLLVGAQMPGALGSSGPSQK